MGLRYWLGLSVAVSLAIAVAVNWEPPPAPDDWAAHNPELRPVSFREIIDGDTLVVTNDEMIREWQVSLACLDAPALTEPL